MVVPVICANDLLQLKPANAGFDALRFVFGDHMVDPATRELRRDGVDSARWNRLNPEQEPRIPWVTECLRDRPGPVIAATDYVRAFADQVRGFLPQEDYIVLGTDGFGRSDTREQLRRFFEVDRYNIAYAALYLASDEADFVTGAVLPVDGGQSARVG